MRRKVAAYSKTTLREFLAHLVRIQKNRSKNTKMSNLEPGIFDSQDDLNSKNVIRRSSLICSQGGDKYTFDSDYIQFSNPRSTPTLLSTDSADRLPMSVSDISSAGSDKASVSSAPSDSQGYQPKHSPEILPPGLKRNSIVHPEKSDLSQPLYINGRFTNPWPTWQHPKLTNILKFGMSKDRSNVPSKKELDLVLPVLKPNFSDFTKPADGIRVTWLGHASILIYIDGITVLTDPIFSDRCSPSQVVGPKRYRDPPCTVDDLPPIDVVVISHNHYDHLDLNTVTKLNNRFQTNLHWFVPLGLRSWMLQAGCDLVTELCWWENSFVSAKHDISFVCTPAQHWSKRTITDDNKSLWCSWSIIGPKHRFFFAGDTGYCIAFKQIGEMYGPFDLAAIPIGAYEPRWFMKYQHVNPEESVLIHEDIKSRCSIGVHWGTFALANEYYFEPPRKLREELEKKGIPVKHFFTLTHGETRIVRDSSEKRSQDDEDTDES